jgi:hypothetical protein
MSESFDVAGIVGCYVYLIRGHNDEVLYVGASTNITYRIGTHLNSGQLSNPEKLSTAKTIEKIRCSGPSAMARIEKELIERYQPPWNTNWVMKVKPTSDPIKTTNISVACQWLADYLQEYGSTPSSQVRAAAALSNISEGCLKRAAKKIGVVVASKSYPGKPHTTVWQLPVSRDDDGRAV